jgi:hypothetical protein
VASIDGFLDHFEFEPAPRQVLRASLRSLRPRSRKSFEPGNVLLWLLVALLHVGLFVMLDFAMRPSTIAQDAADVPLQVTLIRLVETVKPSVSPPPDVRRLPRSQRALPSAEPALQAVSIPQRAVTHTAPTPMHLDTQPALVLYDRQGQIRLPARVIPKQSDPFARPAAADMLPGSDHVLAPGFHVRAELSPQHAVEFVGALLFGGGHFDPCPEYEQRLLNTDNETERDEQLNRYERACPGR